MLIAIFYQSGEDNHVYQYIDKGTLSWGKTYLEANFEMVDFLPRVAFWVMGAMGDPIKGNL